MGIGIGVLLLIVGAVLLTGAVDLPSSVTDVVETDVVGWICVAAGALGVVLGVLGSRRRG